MVPQRHLPGPWLLRRSTATEKYFGKQVSELTLAECASLIAITNNPQIRPDPWPSRTTAFSASKQWCKYRQEVEPGMLKEGSQPGQRPGGGARAELRLRV